MVKYAQIIMGPAGAGKSTYCQHIQEHCANTGRSMRVVNLDPAAEVFKYTVAHDIRDLISVEDVMDELKMGPNGGLVYCMEYLCRSMEWFEEVLEPYGEDDYLLFDCPGQIELYSHVPVMKEVVRMLHSQGFTVAGVYLIDALYVTDAAKLMAGTLMALAAMVNLEIPHINVLTKCDLVPKEETEKYLLPDPRMLVGELNASTSRKFHALNESIGSLIDDYNLVHFVPMNIHDEDSVELVLSHVDHAIAYGEDMEPKEARDDPPDDEADPHSHMEHAATASGAASGFGAIL